MFEDQLKRIRSEVFEETQVAFGIIAGVSQATISKWEKNKLSPELDQLAKIRKEAAKRGIPWQDEWFFSLAQEYTEPPDPHQILERSGSATPSVAIPADTEGAP